MRLTFSSTQWPPPALLCGAEAKKAPLPEQGRPRPMMLFSSIYENTPLPRGLCNRQTKLFEDRVVHGAQRADPGLSRQNCSLWQSLPQTGICCWILHGSGLLVHFQHIPCLPPASLYCSSIMCRESKSSPCPLFLSAVLPYVCL